MASEAAIDDLFTGIGLAFFKLPVAPSARAGITLRVFDFDLDVGGLPSDERLFPAKSGIVLRGRLILVSESSDDRAIWKWKSSIPKCLHRDIISQNDSNVRLVTFFMSDADELPISVARRECYAKHWRSFCDWASG